MCKTYYLLFVIYNKLFILINDLLYYIKLNLLKVDYLNFIIKYDPA